MLNLIMIGQRDRHSYLIDALNSSLQRHNEGFVSLIYLLSREVRSTARRDSLFTKPKTVEQHGLRCAKLSYI